jgi:hypothetical protein
MFLNGFAPASFGIATPEARLGKAAIIILVLAAIALLAGFMMFGNTNLGP